MADAVQVTRVNTPAPAPTSFPGQGAGIDARNRIGALDGLRGLAIIGVMAFHANVLFTGENGTVANMAVSRVFGAGWIGVQLFFVLWGFLITSILLQRKSAAGFGRYVGEFYWRRFLRIFPLYYGFLALYFVALRYLPGIDDATPFRSGDSLSLFLFYYNDRAAFLNRAAPGLHMYWSLCVEEQFYLVWPLLVWHLNVRALRLACAVLFVGALVFRCIALRWPHGIPVAYLATPSVVDGPAIGSLVALMRWDADFWRRWAGYSGAAMAACAAALAAILATQGHFYPNIDARYDRVPLAHDSTMIATWGVSVAILLFGATLIRVLDGAGSIDRGMRRLLEWRVLRSIGFYSYAMYVFHRVLLRVLDYAARRSSAAFGAYPALLAKPLALLVLVGTVYAIARFSFAFLERPFLRLRRYSVTSAVPNDAITAEAAAPSRSSP